MIADRVSNASQIVIEERLMSEVDDRRMNVSSKRKRKEKEKKEKSPPYPLKRKKR